MLPPPSMLNDVATTLPSSAAAAQALPAASAEAATLAGARGTLLTITIGEALVQLGLSPVTAVLPGLAAAVGVSAADGAWLLTGFILALAGTLLVSGRLGDLLGHRRVFGVGALVYAASTVAAVVAPGFATLLAARVAQGIGAAMISGNNLAILSRAVPSRHRAKAIATIAGISSLAAVLGAGFGTAAVALGGWQLLFLATTPLALWAALRARHLPISAAEGKHVPVDWAGAGLLALTISLVAVALNHPHTVASEAVMPVYHAWLPALAIVAAGIFVALERRTRQPLMDWTQLRNAAFAAAVGLNGILHLAMMGSLFLGPVLAIHGLGLDTTAGGMLMVAVQSSVVVAAFVGGWLYDRSRADWIRPASAGLMGLGLAAWAVAGLQGSYPGLVAAGLVAGFGSGVLLTVNNTVIMGILPPGARGVASGMLETTRHFGHAFGVTIPTAILALATAAAGGSLAGTDPETLKAGFFWACLAMVGMAALGVALGLVRPRAAPRCRR